MKTMIKDYFFCDSYAIIELIKGNPEYKRYLDCNLSTSDYNLAEVYYYLLKDHNKETADHYFEQWLPCSVQIPGPVIKKAMEIKLENKKERLSYADCIGYCFSLKTGVLFLTGDSKFMNKPGVEFVR
jgi:uncharacterized protein